MFCRLRLGLPLVKRCFCADLNSPTPPEILVYSNFCSNFAFYPQFGFYGRFLVRNSPPPPPLLSTHQYNAMLRTLDVLSVTDQTTSIVIFGATLVTLIFLSVLCYSPSFYFSGWCCTILPCDLFQQYRSFSTLPQN